MTSRLQENVSFEKMRWVVNAVLLVYPLGYTWPEACVEAFWQSYGENEDQLRIQCYALLQHLCALNGVFCAQQLPACKALLTKPEMTARFILREILAQF